MASKIKKISRRSFTRVLKLVQESYKQELKNAKDETIIPEFDPPPTNVYFDYSVWMRIDYKKHSTIADVVKHPCGTLGCLGGWGCALQLAKTKPTAQLRAGVNCSRPLFNENLALKFYNITPQEGDYLFYGRWHYNGTFADTKDVIAKLKNILKTGKVINPRFDVKYGTDTSQYLVATD